MPRGKESGGKSPKRLIKRYEHTDKKRVSNAPVGLVTPETDPVAPTNGTYDLHCSRAIRKTPLSMPDAVCQQIVPDRLKLPAEIASRHP
ncbi:MAG: hypothetical protein LAO76_22990 [Acidobacteriia bacterium]|nr:hypothetical protein [Terriglobia bacterium]